MNPKPAYQALDRLINHQWKTNLMARTDESHRPVADNVFETTYSNGQRVAVNYQEQPYSLSSGRTVSPRDYLLVQP